jgi:hypothetical protein
VRLWTLWWEAKKKNYRYFVFIFDLDGNHFVANGLKQRKMLLNSPWN